MTRVLTVILAIAALAAGLSACSDQAENTGAGYQSNILQIAHQRDDVFFSMIPLIMREKNLMEKYLPAGTTVEWHNIDVQTDLRDAVVAGQVDIGILPTSQLIIAASNGIPLVPISDFIALRSGLYSHNNGIQNVDDITQSDKISAASLGNAAHTAFQIYCHEKYGDARRLDDNIIPMSYSDMWASVESSDDLSAALISFSDTLRADASDKLNLILDLSPYMRTNGSIALTMEAFYDANPAYITAYRKASKDAVDFILDETREAAILLSNYWQYDVAVIERELENLPPSFEISESGFDNLGAFMYEIGTIREKPKRLSEMPNYADIPKKP